VLALVRNLVEWVPTSADWAAIVAGPLALVGYLAGSLTAAEVGRRRDHAWVAEAVAGAVTLLVATIAWDIGMQAAPRGAFGAVGTYSNQALGAWVSIALWTGAAALVGSVAPVWTGFRGGLTGMGPGVALAAVYVPLLGAAGIVAGALVGSLTGRPRVGVAVGLAVVVGTAYLAWIADLQPTFGITIGPESALWAAVVCGVLFARNGRMAA